MTDYETDSIIQTSLRTELGKDVTLLTVAHRLQTIMDADKIVRRFSRSSVNHGQLTLSQMVLDAGRIVSTPRGVSHFRAHLTRYCR